MTVVASRGHRHQTPVPEPFQTNPATFLFTDIQGPNHLWEDHPGEMRGVTDHREPARKKRVGFLPVGRRIRSRQPLFECEDRGPQRAPVAAAERADRTGAVPRVNPPTTL